METINDLYSENITDGLAQKLYLIAKLKGLTQDKLAKKCRVSRITINRFFKGKTDLRSSDLVELMQCLGISVESMIDAQLESILSSKKRAPVAFQPQRSDELPLPMRLNFQVLTSEPPPVQLFAKTGVK